VRQDLLPYHTGIDTRELFPASQLLTSLISFGPQPNKAIVGRNAFAHEAGIHQDGVLKERTTYEIIDPKAVGVPESRLVLGKHSGRHALAARCETLGYTLTRDQIDEVYRRFITLADRKKGVMDHEIRHFAEQVLGLTETVPEAPRRPDAAGVRRESDGRRYLRAVYRSSSRAARP
jgi:2-isopropylmalate synthase